MSSRIYSSKLEYILESNLSYPSVNISIFFIRSFFLFILFQYSGLYMTVKYLHCQKTKSKGERRKTTEQEKNRTAKCIKV